MDILYLPSLLLPRIKITLKILNIAVKIVKETAWYRRKRWITFKLQWLKITSIQTRQKSQKLPQNHAIILTKKCQNGNIIPIKILKLPINDDILSTKN